MENTLTIQSATAEDREAIVALLEESGLPTRDLPANLAHFLVVKENARIIGTVGLESFGEAALLRSLAISASWQSKGLGKQLLEAAQAYARSQQVEVLYLITTTADRFFEKLGFHRIGRDTVPLSIQGTAQFSGVCPSSAIVMEKVIRN